jgi:regulator of nucleoside diphosphate kinase
MNNYPNIVVSSLDADRLEPLLEAMSASAFPGKDDLERELARAEMRAPENMPPDVVTMNSTVRFRVSSSNEAFSLRLVYPQAVHEEGTVSIFAPVGSALIGLRQGDEIKWPTPSGGVMNVTIEEIIYQPERAGEYHR